MDKVGRSLGIRIGEFFNVIGGYGGWADLEVIEVGVQVVHDDGVEVVELVEVASASWVQYQALVTRNFGCVKSMSR